MRKIIPTIVSCLVNRIYSDYSSESQSEDQNRQYLALGLEREAAVKRIDSICLANFGKHFSENIGMWSEHLVLFTAISMKRSDIARILEIGTFKGETTKLLGMIFPEASITTIDLSPQEIQDQGIYNYAINSIVTARRKETSDRITFKEMNSVQLIHETEKYDLIWVDGAHTVPISIIDIANSIRLLSEKGVAICDDVYLKPNYLDKVSDVSSYETLKAFQEAGIISFTLIKKRLSKKFNNLLIKTKYIGVFKLN